jgi:hypothetical protein
VFGYLVNRFAKPTCPRQTAKHGTRLRRFAGGHSLADALAAGGDQRAKAY